MSSPTPAPPRQSDLEGQIAPPPADAAPQKQYTGKHPVAAFFHVFFKVSAVLVYLFCSIFSDNFVANFVSVMMLLAFDFWTTKNVTGRLLVGLRWWNEVKEDGTNEWIFEAADGTKEINSVDKYIFWGSLVAEQVVWGFFALACILKLNFQWLLLVIMALVLGSAQIGGYFKCMKDAKKQMQQGIMSVALSRFMAK